MSLWRKSEEIAGFLDHNTEFTGELHFSNTLRIDGTFHGSIIGADRLIIGEKAVVHADIRVGDIEIRGQVFGNVEVARQAEIFSSGRLRGDLRAAVLIIQAGAVLEGRSYMSGAEDAVAVREHTLIQISDRAHKAPTPSSEQK